MLVSLAVIILPEIFKGDGTVLVDKDVPPEPDYRFPPPKEAPKAPPMAKAPIVPVGDAAKAPGDQKAEQGKSEQAKVEEEKKDAPADASTSVKADSDKADSEKKAPEVKQSPTKVEPEPEASKPGQVSAFVVQVGSFSSEPNAVALRDKLRKMGFACFVEAVKGKQGMVYRVRVGPELTRKLAGKLKEDLAKKAKIDGLVQSYP